MKIKVKVGIQKEKRTKPNIQKNPNVDSNQIVNYRCCVPGLEGICLV